MVTEPSFNSLRSTSYNMIEFAFGRGWNLRTLHAGLPSGNRIHTAQECRSAAMLTNPAEDPCGSTVRRKDS